MRALNTGKKQRRNGAKATGDSPTGDSPNILVRCTTCRQILVSSPKGKVIARQRCLSVDSTGYVLAMLAYEKTDWFSLIFSIEYLKCGDDLAKLKASFFMAQGTRTPRKIDG